MENWFTVKFFSLFTCNLPVDSKELNVPRQKRFLISYKGKILDFDKATMDKKESYLNEEEIKRQNSPGLRFRNSDANIKCKYFYINSKEKVSESRKRIGKLGKEKFKNLNYYSARKKRSLDLNNNEIVLSAKKDSKVLCIYVHGKFSFYTLNSLADFFRFSFLRRGIFHR